ncbi:MAG: YceH family protein [Actinomycetota bacterium]|nr:YceH family protein [Actinomycetota bacterium]
MEADAVEIRVLGCLIEKQRTTPDAYPLSLNSLRLACNQATAREPVVVYQEREIKAALDRMSNRGWTRFASGASSRALKYRHLLDEALGLSRPELSLLGVLMLRGAQTVGELKQRSERLHGFESIAEVTRTLDALAQRELVERLERRPGKKEERWRQLLGADSSEETLQPESQEPQLRRDDHVAAIEERLGRLERAFDDLLSRLDKVPDRE